MWPLTVFWALVLLAAVPAVTFSAYAPFDFPQAQTQLFAAFSAYCGKNVESDFSCYWCEKLTATEKFEWAGNFGDSGGAAFGFVGCLGGSTIQVSWRGTDNLKGWIADADFKKTPFNGSSGAEVHLGFWQTYSDVSVAVFELIEQARQKGCGTGHDIAVTGHSLGAALATLNAVELASRDSQLRVQLNNFGCPRVGNRAFATLADKTLVFKQRFTHRRDVVPHLPFQSLDFWHTGREYWQNLEQKYVECNGSGEDPTCADSIDITDPLDHALYLGQDVLDGIPHDCLYTDP